MKRYLMPLNLVESTASWKGNRSVALQERSANDWVHLVVLPSAFSYDQALLITRLSEDEWLAWVPDYGEVTLHVSEFYASHELN